MATTTKLKNQFYTGGASIDANYGPWASLDAYISWLKNTVGLEEPYEGTVIAIKSDNGTVTKYIWANSAWKEDSGITEEQKAQINKIQGKQDSIADLEDIREGARKGATALQPVAGKGLSSNDYTDDDKAEVAKVAALSLKVGELDSAVEQGVTAAAESAGVAEAKATEAASKVAQAEASVSQSASSATAIQNALDAIKGSGDIPAATVVQVAENTSKLSELESQVSGGGSDDVVIIPKTAKDIVGNETSTINIIPNTSVDVKAGNTVTIDVDGCPEITRRWYFYNNGVSSSFYSKSAEIELTEDLASVRIAITSPSSALTGVSGTVTAKIYIKGKEGGEGLMQKVQKNTEDIAEAKANIDSLSDDVEGVKNAVGDIKEKLESKEIKNELTYEVGGINGGKVSIGSQVSVGYNTSTSYARTIISANKDRTYKIVTHTSGATATNYPNFIFLADLEGKCIAKYGNYTGVETDVEATITPTEDSLIFVCIKPAQTAYPEKSVSVIETYTEKYPFQEQIDDINEQIDGRGGSETNRNADVALLFQQTNRRYIEDFLTDKYWNGEKTSGYDNLKSRLDSHKANGHVVFALCSDTHEGGEYNTRSSARSADRAITVYNKLASYCDAAIHCGDISTDYGTAKSKLLAFSRGVIEKFTHNKPFLIVKGNHDNNENQYSEVDFSDIDFSKNTYYHQYQSGKFEDVSEADWRGEQLLIADEDFVTDKEFKNNVQKYKCPTSAVWGNGAYYYYDIADKNLRVIVLNIYAVNDEGVRKLGEEYKWLAEVALNVPSGYSVVTLAHTALTNNTYLKDIINAFRNGTRTSGSVDDVSWDKTFSGSGKYVGNLHGHEHGYKYESASGFNDIGFTWSNCVAVTTSTTDDERGDASKYGISVVAIDVTNRKIYDEQISGETREYSY